MRRTKGDVRGMMEDVVVRLKDLTDVDFERDSAKRENEFSSLRSLLSQFIENEMRSKCQGGQVSGMRKLIPQRIVYS